MRATNYFFTFLILLFSKAWYKESNDIRDFNILLAKIRNVNWILRKCIFYRNFGQQDNRTTRKWCKTCWAHFQGPSNGICCCHPDIIKTNQQVLFLSFVCNHNCKHFVTWPRLNHFLHRSHIKQNKSLSMKQERTYKNLIINPKHLIIWYQSVIYTIKII